MYVGPNYPGFGGSLQSGINDASQMVGFYDATPTLMESRHGYFFDGSVFSPIDVPGTDLTISNGINNSGQIVGNYVDGSGIAHGYLLDWDGGIFSTIDVPDAVGTTAADINNAGQIVGAYTDANGVQHGFSANPVPEPGTLILFGTGLFGLLTFVRRKLRKRK